VQREGDSERVSSFGQSYWTESLDPSHAVKLGVVARQLGEPVLLHHGEKERIAAQKCPTPNGRSSWGLLNAEFIVLRDSAQGLGIAGPANQSIALISPACFGFQADYDSFSFLEWERFVKLENAVLVNGFDF